MASSSVSSARHNTSDGFSLLELAVVVTVLGLITAIALPAYARIQRNARFGALINDYRVLTSAFQQYVTVNATWPAAAGTRGVFPQGMEEYLRSTNWSQPTVFGGQYNWDQGVTHNGRKIKAAIAIYPTEAHPVTMTTAEMQRFDERFDDGNLATGHFQQGYGGCPLYVIEDDTLATTNSPKSPTATDEAHLSDIENLDDAEQAAAKQAVAEQAAQAQAAADKTASEKAAADSAAKEAAEKEAADQAEKEAAESAAVEQAAKAAAEKAEEEAAAKAAAEQAAKDAAAKAAVEQAAADKAAAEQAAAEKAAQEAANQAAADKAAAEAAKNTPSAKAQAQYDSLAQRAATVGVKVPGSLNTALTKLQTAANTLAQTNPADTKLLDKNTKAYNSAQTAANKALASFEKTVVKAETK